LSPYLNEPLEEVTSRCWQGPYWLRAKVELLLISREQQVLERGAVGFATGLLVGVHLLDGTMLLREGTKLVQLVRGVLAFVFCRHPRVDSHSHKHNVSALRAPVALAQTSARGAI
jgi:hypothetical protein